MKNLLKQTASALLLLLIVANGWVLFSKLVLHNDLPSFFGIKAAVVLSGSMEPTFSAGDVLVYAQQSGYEINDIVIFACESTFVTHRIIGAQDGCFITQGDANPAADQALLDPTQIEGKLVFVLPTVGNVVLFFATPLGLLLLFAGGVLLFEVPKFFK